MELGNSHSVFSRVLTLFILICKGVRRVIQLTCSRRIEFWSPYSAELPN